MTNFKLFKSIYSYQVVRSKQKGFLPCQTSTVWLKVENEECDIKSED
jgi:hypothetical protein